GCRPLAVERLVKDAYPGGVGDGGRVFPAAGVQLDVVDGEVERDRSRPGGGEAAHPDPPCAERVVADLVRPGGGFAVSVLPGPRADVGAVALGADVPDVPGGVAGAELDGGAEGGGAAGRLELEGQLDDTCGEDGQAGPVLAGATGVGERQGQRRGVADGLDVQ